MAKKPKKPKAKIIGEDDDWTDEQIEKDAAVGPEDIAAAKAHWRRLAPKRGRRLLDATEPEEDKP